MLILWKYNKQKGVLIVEILVVIAIIAVALVSLLGVANFSLRVSNSLKKTLKANSLARETIEAVRNFRDGTVWNSDGLGSLLIDTLYHQEKTTDTPPKWNLVAGEETIGIYTRRIVFKKVFRDTNDNIVDSGTEDPDTKKIIVTVSWEDKKVELETYLTNWNQ